MKKKRQSEPSGDIDNESTESCEDNQNKSACNHALKAVDFTRVKKVLLKEGLQTECAECLKSKNVSPPDAGAVYDTRLWLCLRCGNQSCGRLTQHHAMGHFLKSHSDSHALCMDTTNWSVYCYECDRDIPPKSRRKKLLEACDYIKKHSTLNTLKLKPAENEIQVEPEAVGLTNDVKEQDSKITSVIASLPRVRGLTNLGNTCFFNAVLQNLAQTPFLVPVLKEMSIEGEKFCLPGGDFKYKDITEELPPIAGELSAWGSLTEELAITLNELQSSGGVFNPKGLLTRLSTKLPQFGGGDQEDSHELLRHLLELVVTEDLKRYQRIILEHSSLLKTDPSTVDEITAQKIKFYGIQASNMLLRPEQVFRGVLVSTLQCQQCLHTSCREESFLDLSLPIMPDKPQPPIMRRKSELEEENKQPSKHQLKREKKAARKLMKKNKVGIKVQADSTIITEENNDDFTEQNSGESEQSDADVEDNLEDATKILSTPDDKSDYNINEKLDSPEKLKTFGPETEVNILNDVNSKLSINCEDTNHLESDHAPVDNLPAMSDETYADLQKLTARLAAGIANDDSRLSEAIHSVSQNVSPNSSCCSDFSSPDQPQTTESRNDVSPDDVSSGPSKINPPSPVPERSNVIALGWEPSTKTSPTSEMFSYSNERAPLTTINDEDNRNMYNSPLRDSATFGARYQCDDGECSVLSCLNQFTSLELMTGSNKVCCEACTKRSKDGKTVYTNSTKQLLIASPPAVLILHLKRFQVFRSLFKKMSKAVTFPLILDLAPFCNNSSKQLPSMNYQNRLLYSLYGVVEHSGTLHGGHYVAYVKVRPKLEKDDPRWKFLPPTGSKSTKLNSTTAIHADDTPPSRENVSEPKPPPGKWYYVSDSHVTEATESRVLKAQAYLLFYERIM